MNRLFPDLCYTMAPGDCHPELPRAGEYHAMSFGLGSLSYEEAVFLYGLVIGSKPTNVLETGAETGASAVHIARALADQGFGHLYTVEIEPIYCEATRKVLADAGLLKWATVVNQDALHFIRTTDLLFDMAFLDTSISLRIEEFRRVKGRMRRGSLVAIHDTRPEHPMGDMRIDAELSAERMIHLPSPRRMSIVQV